MSTTDKRIRKLNDKAVGSDKSCVLYVMARDQRINDNYALSVAQQQAVRSGVPLAVIFCLLPRTGQRAQEHYRFMLQGLEELEAGLAKLNIPLMLHIGRPQERLTGVLHHLKPQAVIFDMSPLRGPLKLHADIAAQADCAVFEVDTHNIVPVWQASDHQEIGARTLRPKYQRMMTDYLDEAPAITKHPHTWPGTVQTMKQLQPKIDALVKAVPANGTDISRFKPGEAAAHKALTQFIESNKLKNYAETRNDPAKDGQSELNPYLHYGQLSSAAVIRAVLEAVGDAPAIKDSADSFIEEITVRRELSDNFCFYNPHYDSLEGAPEWARRSLDKHLDDTREFTYSRDEFEQAKTHDPAWNAAQTQLVETGKIHGYMRMYWAKKVLEWSASPQEALKTMLYLNDFYHLDGGDPAGYVGILWSLAGLHDRPWGDRAVYGGVRSMVYNGLKRKFDIQAYEQRWQ